MTNKKVNRTISRNRFVTAGIITFLIFALGVLLGVIIDYERVQYMENQYMEHELNYRSLQLQFSFLNSLHEDDNGCAAFETTLKDVVAELSDSLEQVEKYNDLSSTQGDNFEKIERRYLLDNIRYWLLIRDAEEVCPSDRLSILYFFSADKCDACPDQGVILTYFKKLYGEQLLVFPIDVDLIDDEPIVEVIKNAYNISTYPSIVIGDTAFTGVISKEELKPVICKGFGYEENC